MLSCNILIYLPILLLSNFAIAGTELQTLRTEIFAGRKFCGTNFRGINFRDFGYELRKLVPRNLRNIEQPRQFVPQNLMIFQLKKTDFIKPSLNKKNE